MTAQPGFNPTATTNAAGTFNTSSVGLVQGTYYEDPVSRFALASGFLLNTETVPMWGGVAVYGDVPVGASGGTSPMTSQGLGLGRATGISGAKQILGWSVFNQAYGMYDTPQSPVPLAGSYNQVMYLPLGSGARLAVGVDPSLAVLRGENVFTQVSWDWTNQILIPYTGTLTISSGTYTSATGIIVLTMSAPVTFDAGDSVVLSSLTGTGAFASLDGTWTSTVVSGSTITLQGPIGAGAATITGGSATLGSGSDVAVNVKVLDVQTSNCMTVNYNAATANASWNYNGACAVIQI